VHIITAAIGEQIGTTPTCQRKDCVARETPQAKIHKNNGQVLRPREHYGTSPKTSNEKSRTTAKKRAKGIHLKMSARKEKNKKSPHTPGKPTKGSNMPSAVDKNEPGI